ncbi:hypothetical protein PanWU01x14_262810, partial [Parasponia andersonii]
ECHKIETIPPTPREVMDSRWKASEAGLLKLNTDATFGVELNKIRVGIFVRDHRSQVPGCAELLAF